MARNVEIKLRIENFDETERRVAAFSDSGPAEIVQDDTFFECSRGRSKLPAFDEKRGELIFYQRADETGPKSRQACR